MELCHINPIKTQKAYMQIVQTIIGLIAEGKLEYGNKLYNEQELLTLLGVSRPTLREALRVLEFLGIATVSPRRGIVINRPDDTSGYLPLIYILLFEKTGERELFELRQALQIEMVGVAALEHTKADVKALENIITRTEQGLSLDYMQFAQLDYDFHLEIIRCSKNKLALKLMNTLASMIKEQLQEVIRDMPIEHRNDTVVWHREITRHISLGDEYAARDTMRSHLKRSYSKMSTRPISLNL